MGCINSRKETFLPCFIHIIYFRTFRIQVKTIYMYFDQQSIVLIHLFVFNNLNYVLYFLVDLVMNNTENINVRCTCNANLKVHLGFILGLLLVCFLKISVHSGLTLGSLGFTFGELSVCFSGSLYALNCEEDSSFFLPYSKYTFSVCFQGYASDRGLIYSLCLLWIYYGLALGPLK